MGNWRPRSPVEYLAIFWRRKFLILLFAAGIAVAALTVVREIPRTYQSQALLIIAEHATKDSDTMSARITGAREQALSSANLASLIERYQLNGANETMDSAVQRLRKAIKIETKLTDYYPQSPETLTVSFRHRNPKVAQEVLSSFVSTFEETNEAIRKRAESEVSWLGSQIAELETQLSTLGSPRPFTTDAKGPANEAHAARLTLLSAIDALNDKQYALEQQIAEQNRQILEQERIVKSEQNTAPKDGAYGVLLVRKAELGAQLADYATQYTEKNPKVIQARTQLDEINRQLAALETKYQSGGATATPAVHDLLLLQRDLIRLQTELEITRREAGRKQTALGSLPKTENSVVPKDVDNINLAKVEAAHYDRLLTRYSALVAQRDSILKSGVVDGDVAPLFQIVDPPSLPQQPAGPTRLLFAGLALALAIGIGLLVVPIAEGRALLMIQDRRDIEYYLGVPLLAMIPETLTPRERSLKWRSKLLCRVGVLLLALVGPGIVFALKHFGILRQVF